MLVVMIGIRKSLDCVFTRRELKILDDIMPEMSKRAAADDLHQLDAEVGFRQKYLPAFMGGRGKRQPKGAGLDIGFGGVGGGVGSAGGANDLALLKCNTSNANEKEFEAQSSLLKKWACTDLHAQARKRAHTQQQLHNNNSNNTTATATQA